ncbi:MAG: helix-turn-helix domain-containing protein [Thermoanaerobacteraceae bacterium]
MYGHKCYNYKKHLNIFIPSGGEIMLSSIGNKIKALRLQKNLSQSELCGNFMSRVVLSRIENGKALPSLEQLAYFAEKLEVPVSYFFSDSTGEKYILFEKNSSLLKDLFLTKNYYEIIKWSEENHNAFCEVEDSNKYYYLGMSYFYSNIFDKALEILKKYINAFTKSNTDFKRENIEKFSDALNSLFKIMLKNKNYEKGIHYLELARKYLYQFNALSLPVSFAIHNNLAYTYLKTCQFQKAVIILENFINYNNDIISLKIMPDMYTSLNIAYYNLGNYEKALYYIKKAILLFEFQGNHLESGKCYLNYINTLRHSSKFKEAFEVLEKAKNDYKDVPELYHKFKIQEMILYFNIGMYEKVIEFSESINTSLLSMRGKKELAFMLGHVKYLNKEFEEAYRFLKKCEKYFAEEIFYNDLSVIYEDLYAITGNVNYREKVLAVKNKLGRKNVIVK